MERSSLVAEVMEVMDSAFESWVVVQWVLVPSEVAKGAIASVVVDLPVLGLGPGMLAVVGAFLIDLRRMTFFEQTLTVGSVVFVDG